MRGAVREADSVAPGCCFRSARDPRPAVLIHYAARYQVVACWTATCRSSCRSVGLEAWAFGRAPVVGDLAADVVGTGAAELVVPVGRAGAYSDWWGSQRACTWVSWGLVEGVVDYSA